MIKLNTYKISDLAPADYNPRQISNEALSGLKASIERFGYVEPIIFNTKTGRVVGGHQRLKVLQGMGVDEIDVLEVSLDETEEKALNITLNNPHIQGEFTDSLQDLLGELQENFPEFEELNMGELIGYESPNIPTGKDKGDFDPSEHWNGMPEYEQEDLTAHRSIILHFPDQAAVEAFFVLIGQKYSDKVRYLWYPEQEKMSVKDLRYE